MLSRFMPYIIAVLVISCIGMIYAYGEGRYADGRVNETAKYEKQISSLKSVVNAANIEAVRTAKLQAKQVALIEESRAAEYELTTTTLNKAEAKIRRLQHASEDICVNRPIPIAFR